MALNPLTKFIEQSYPGANLSPEAPATPVANKDLMEDAGSVKIDQPQMWGKGIIRDIKRTVGTHWVGEVTNFNQKTVAVTLLLFISVFAPTLTFGAVYGKFTDNRIGTVETILATSWVGIAYSLIGGMPMCIIGSTGPVLAFTKALANIAEDLGVPFLAFNFWVSAWLLIFTFLAAFFDLTRVVRLATRFTDEIFALLIVSIFVMDAAGDPFSDVGILRYFDPNHPSHDEHTGDAKYNYREVALLSVVLGFGTTFCIFFFRSFKNSAFFCNDLARTSIHDYAVTVSVLLSTMAKEFLFPSIKTEQLSVPETFEPSFLCCDSSCTTQFPEDCTEVAEAYGTRPWMVDVNDLNGKEWVRIVAAAPALFAFLLLFLDNGITWHLINHKSHNLKHGEAYNYDLVLNGLFNFVNGLFGLPWLVATTVPCIIHLNALADKDEKGHFISVQETRLTNLSAHLMLGLSLLVLSVLELLPMPVLYGVFLFMGISSLVQMQFWHRLLLFFKQPSKHPKTVYTIYIENKRTIHLYTVLQIFFFGLVFTVQNFPAIAVAFPLMTLLCIPGRLYLLPRLFEGWELLLLDGENEEIEKWTTLKQHSMRVSEGAVV